MRGKKLSKILAAITASALALSVMAFTPMFSFADGDDTGDAGGAGVTQNLPNPTNIFSWTEQGELFAPADTFAQNRFRQAGYDVIAVEKLPEGWEWYELAYVGNTAPDLWDHSSNTATQLTWSGTPSKSTANGKDIVRYRVVSLIKTITNLNENGRTEDLVYMAEGGAPHADMTTVGSGRTLYFEDIIYVIGKAKINYEGNAQDTVLWWDTSDEGNPVYNGTSTPNMWLVGTEDHPIKIQLSFANDHQRLSIEFEPTPPQPEPEPEHKSSGGGIASMVGGGGGGGGTTATTTTTEISSTATPISDESAAVNAIENLNQGSVTIDSDTGVTTEIMEALADTMGDVTVFIPNQTHTVIIDSNNVDPNGEMKDLNFDAAVSIATQDTQEIAGGRNRTTTTFTMSFEQDGDFGAIESVRIAMHITDQSLAGQVVKIYAVNADGTKTRIDTRKVLVSGNGVINFNISDFRDLVFEVSPIAGSAPVNRGNNTTAPATESAPAETEAPAATETTAE